MLRDEGGERCVVVGGKPPVAGHDLRGMHARFHVDEVLAVGEQAPHLHFMQKLAE